MKRSVWILAAALTIMVEVIALTAYGAVIHIPQQEIRGYIYLSNIYGEEFKPIYPRALYNLGEALKKYTSIKVLMNRHYYLSDRQIRDLPFLYLVTDEHFELFSSEVENLREYVAGGGFILADNGDPFYEHGPAEASFHKMFEDILGSSARPVPLAISHEVYNIYFPFEDGPPLGIENVYPSGPTYDRCRGEKCTITVTYEPEPVEYLEGYFLNGRLVGVFCNKGYGGLWNENSDNEPQLKIGVNIIILALSQHEYGNSDDHPHWFIEKIINR